MSYDVKRNAVYSQLRVGSPMSAFEPMALVCYNAFRRT
jgi:hypothetical protein